ncbi:hypothetical protein MKW98_021362 [Papaver atlanticum]|uniref:MIP18 family-like domain-containing protein n=1 Tax=Papaver atlanticum TaxID=357466 RepID=A0AAD4XIR0_9MAGN|nr:hypothetical protein MKW98_021362 [Papaver atlanticum]
MKSCSVLLGVVNGKLNVNYATEKCDKTTSLGANSLLYHQNRSSELVNTSVKNLTSYQRIKDPEYPYSLEELKVVTEDSVEINDKHSHVRVTFTPTKEGCPMVSTIGLCLRVKLMRSLPSRYKVDVRVAPGTHANEAAVNKQLNDKEWVAAALENPGLGQMIDQCLAPTNE